MTLDNSRTIIRLRIRLFFALVILIAFLVLAYFARVIKFPLLGLSDTVWILILVGINIFIAFLPMVLNYQYIFYSDDSEKIIVRHFTAGIVGGRKNSVEIDKRSFAGYKMESRMFGMIRSITLQQQFKEGRANYPPVYISALSREERDKIKRSLDLYAPPIS
jgi:hypothetical protein